MNVAPEIPADADVDGFKLPVIGSPSPGEGRDPGDRQRAMAGALIKFRHCHRTQALAGKRGSSAEHDIGVLLEAPLGTKAA